MERGQPLHAADRANPRAAARFPASRQGLQGLPDRRGRHPRPGGRSAGQEPDVHVDDPLRRRPSARRYKGRRTSAASTTTRTSTASATGHPDAIKALGCKQIWLTETGGLYEFGSFFKASQSAPAEGDEVPVQARPPEQEDQARLRVHVVRRRDARASTPASSPRASRAPPTPRCASTSSSVAGSAPPHRRHGRADRGGGSAAGGSGLGGPAALPRRP